jgi:SGNH hydrolase-like domain, acetyltransferase AlgX
MTRLIAGLIIIAVAVSVVTRWFVTAELHPFHIMFHRYSVGMFALNTGLTFLAAMICYVLMGRTQWRQKAGNAIVCLSTILLLLFLAEFPALMGWIDYRTYMVPKMVGGPGPHNRQTDSDLLFHRHAHDQFLSRQRGDEAMLLGVAASPIHSTEYRYDRNGYRNDQDFVQADIVVIGDSFVEGYLVPQARISSTRLAELFETNVCNLGQADYGPGHELTVLRKIGIPLRPKFVVWLFYEGNDLSDLAEYEWASRDPRAYDRVVNGFDKRSFTFNALARFGGWTNSLLWWDSSLVATRSGIIPSKDSRAETRMYFVTEPQGSSVQTLNLLNRTFEILTKASSLCESSATRLLVVYVPLKFRVYRDLLRLSDESDLKRWRVNDFPDRFGRWCRSAGIDYVDLTPALRREAADGSLVYFPDDEHWTDEGHRVAAEEIARAIKATGWLSSELRSSPRPAQPHEQP